MKLIDEFHISEKLFTELYSIHGDHRFDDSGLGFFDEDGFELFCVAYDENRPLRIFDEDGKIDSCVVQILYETANKSSCLESLEQLSLMNYGSRSELWRILSYVATNKHTTTKILGTLVERTPHNKDLRHNLLQDVLKNPKTPKETLIKFATSTDPQDRYYVAKNPSLPKDVAISLLDDTCDEVVCMARCNPSIGVEEIKKFADTETNTDCELLHLRNPATPFSVLKKTFERMLENKAEDKCGDLFWFANEMEKLIHHPNVTPSLFKSFKFDGGDIDNRILRLFLERSSIPLEHSLVPQAKLHELAQNPNVTTENMVIIARIDETQEETLDILSKHRYYKVRLEVAKRSKTLAILDRLSMDRMPPISTTALQTIHRKGRDAFIN